MDRRGFLTAAGVIAGSAALPGSELAGVYCNGLFIPQHEIHAVRTKGDTEDVTAVIQKIPSKDGTFTTYLCMGGSIQLIGCQVKDFDRHIYDKPIPVKWTISEAIG